MRYCSEDAPRTEERNVNFNKTTSENAVLNKMCKPDERAPSFIFIQKKSYVTCKKTLNALCEKQLQFSMFKWTSFYNFLEFHCKILNSSAIYRCKKMVKILKCYLYAKKSYGTLSKGAIFFGQPCNSNEIYL